MQAVKFFAVTELPSVLVANALYFVQAASGEPVTLYVTSNTTPTITSPVGQVSDIQAGAGITLEEDPDMGKLVISSTPGSWSGSAEARGLGDSLMYGDQVGGPANSWLAKFAALRGYTVAANAGINGSTLANGTGSSNPMVDRWPAAVPLGFSGHVPLMGSTNDYTLSLPLGAPGSTDPGTIYGALLTIGRGVLERGPCFLHLLTPSWRGDIAEGTRNSAGYTMEQARQAVRDVAAQLAREYPGRAELIDVGRDLADGLRAAGMMGADQLHPTLAGHTLMGQYVAMHAAGTVGTVLPPPAPNYSRTFSTLTPGNLSGQDGWVVYGESGTVTASGLDVAAPFDTQPRGVLHPLPVGVTRVAMRLTTANFLAAAGNGIMLRAFHQLSDNRAICAWLYKASANPVARLDCGIVQGSNVAFWIGSNGPDIPSDDVWLEVLRAGGQIEVRMWDASGIRPAAATYTHTDDSLVADAFGVSTIGPGTRLVKAVNAQ
ncbi:SGNH/GDSL hydrolase family protein [Deinococcus hopiensis]|uniref:Lysophospholipase L1 n=1 Tax=Deinococcus hopiensis KR-140 TaxID=695939 RepID=A0A1W1V7D5_9DEIO|nr:SGNH/GDSL hydrolase family protein [Deinococcus hopiensis]SMB89215.1 Lysophospholipase L1 [Deinococcus hopiensis KR-140]